MRTRCSGTSGGGSLIRGPHWIVLACTLVGCSASVKVDSVIEQKSTPAMQTLLSGDLKPGVTIHIPVAAASKLSDQLPGRKVIADERRE